MTTKTARRTDETNPILKRAVICTCACICVEDETNPILKIAVICACPCIYSHDDDSEEDFQLPPVICTCACVSIEDGVL